MSSEVNIEIFFETFIKERCKNFEYGFKYFQIVYFLSNRRRTQTHTYKESKETSVRCKMVDNRKRCLHFSM